MKVLKIGLKIWSTNQNYLSSVKELKDQGIFDYIELFVAPDSSEDHIKMWKDLDVPFLLHAPHSYAGLNLSDKELEQQNRLLIHKVKLFEMSLRAEKIIFHPGINGALDETIRQINLFKTDFPDVFNKMIIENKPKIGLGGEICVGATYDEILKTKQETGCGFCFDIGHAMCFASWAKQPWEVVMDEFLRLEPEVFHLSDGDVGTVYDDHRHFGEGNYDLQKILSKVPDGSYLSIETHKDSNENLNDFIKDVNYLRESLRRENGGYRNTQQEKIKLYDR